MTYTCLINLRTTCVWVIDFYLAIDNKDQALRYYRLLNYIENKMWNFKVR